MSASAMEDGPAGGDEKSPEVLLSAPPTSIPSSAPPFPTTARPISTGETMIENRAVSVASDECGSALPSPAEASPAKPAGASSSNDGAAETSQATSGAASASDSSSRADAAESLSPSAITQFSAFGCQDPDRDFPTVLTFKGVSVTLENNNVWKKFCSCGTEMILTKPGRRMFPYCRYRLSGLDPLRRYSLVLSIVPSDPHRYRRNGNKWEASGAAEHHSQGLIRAFSHPSSPNVGTYWMSNLVSFYKMKLTNNTQDQDGHIILHSMQRYIPRLHVIPEPDGGLGASLQPVVKGPESMTFTFPQTEFIAVTSYQNFQITQLKIDHNPFARGFRDDGNNGRLQKSSKDPQPGEVQSDKTPEDAEETEEEVKDLSMKVFSPPAPLPNMQEIRLVLKPIMSNPTNKAEPFTPCIQGNYALGELVLVEKPPLIEPKEEETPISITPEEEEQRGAEESTSPKSRSATPVSSSSTPTSSPEYRKKKKKRMNRGWANSRGRDWKPAAVSSAAFHGSPTVQPMMDDVEGLLFASFTSKEDLRVHFQDKPAADASPTPVSATPTKQSNETMELKPETDGEMISRLQPVLLNDLCVLRHRQVIHPVLQEVGMKLSSLDPSKPIDLQYLGVCLPLPPPNLPEKPVLSPGDEGSPFVSRTGKTSDVTKIKGWKTKFTRSKETSPTNCEGLQKNLSAFCSNMLDEYLESEAQRITERAAAFSASPEGSVAYQLPAKSSSYVKTLDSALKHRNAASKAPVGTNKPCPLSHKPLLYSALVSPPPPLASPAASRQTGAPCRYNFSPSHLNPAADSSSNSTPVDQSGSTRIAGLSQKPAAGSVPSQGTTRRPPGLTKTHLMMLQMETGSENKGLNRTNLTPDRLSAALSVILTKEMSPSQTMKLGMFPKNKSVGLICGQAHCRLGCVCPSVEPLTNPAHCRKPQCMLSCVCNITVQTKEEETEQQIHPAHSMTNVEQAVQPRPGSQTNKLWSHNNHDEDPEPLFTPRSAPLCGEDDSSDQPIVLDDTSVPHPPQPQIREEDKDPVYKYLESMMTCARVRAINSKPPSQAALEQNIMAVSAQNSRTASVQRTSDSQARSDHHTASAVTNQVKTAQKTAAIEKGAKKQIQIQSLCPWQKDRRMVLEALCLRMKQNRLCKRFCVGPYCVNPVSKIHMQKPSGAIITYRMQISKRSKDSDSDEDDTEDDTEDSDEEEDQEEGEIEGPEMLLGVTPFLRGVLPAGRLRVRRKTVGVQEQGLVQVNGKSYNHARLMLGNIGSLHPANRLAAYVTGRLRVPNNSGTKHASCPSVNVKAEDTAVPPVITGKKALDVKTPSQPQVSLGQVFQPDHRKKEPAACPQVLQCSLPINPVQPVISSHSHFAGSLPRGSPCSPVSLTVSPSLKRPSFLEDSGTYSFRICPPSNQGAEGQKLPGVSLPGGFTLIQLPKPGADGVAQQQGPANNAGRVDGDAAPLRKNGALRFSKLAAEWLGTDTGDKIPNLLRSKPVEPALPSETTGEEAQPSDKSDEDDHREEESNSGDDSDDLSSDSSDYIEDDDSVDIETVEESQGLAIAQMRAAVSMKLKASGIFCSDEAAKKELHGHNPINKKCGDKRQNHTALERVRRSEQRFLFNKLNLILQCDPKTPRLTVLSKAREEIQRLVSTSKILEQKRRLLAEKQAVYIKKLSLLSGKSGTQIKTKLTEICNKQKTRESTSTPFFSHLLHSRAAQLQASASLSKPKLPSEQEQEGQTPSQGDLPIIPVHKNIRQMISMLKPHIHTASTESCGNPAPPPPPPPPPPLPPVSQPKASPALAAARLPSPQAGIEPGEVVETVQVGRPASKLANTPEAAGASENISTPRAETEHHAATEAARLQAFKAQNAHLSAWLKKRKEKPHGAPQQPLTLPLIRSKTGRLILPSCLKPVGQGLYTLTIMKSTKGAAGEGSPPATVQPSDRETSKDEEKKPPESEHSGLSESESEDSDAPLDSNPKASVAPNPLAELVVLNRSLAFPSMGPNASQKSQEVLTNSDMNKIIAAARLTFKQVCQKPVSGEPEPVRSSAVKHPRGQPPQILPAKPACANEMRLKDSGNSKASENAKIVMKERERIETKAENSAAARRGRGRPPKRKSPQPLRPAVPVKRAVSCPSKPKEDDPTISPYTYRSAKAAGDASRPLTRGALGKDFPSAKKRSWIDVEKELEADGDDE